MTSVLGKSWWVDRDKGEVRKFVNKKTRTIFPNTDRTGKFSKGFMMTDFFLWSYWKHCTFISANARATKTKTDLFSCHFRGCANSQTTRKGYCFEQKSFLWNNFSKTQISEISSWAVHLSGPYSKIRTGQGGQSECSFSLWASSAMYKLQLYWIEN